LRLSPLILFLISWSFLLSSASFLPTNNNINSDRGQFSSFVEQFSNQRIRLHKITQQHAIPKQRQGQSVGLLVHLHQRRRTINCKVSTLNVGKSNEDNDSTNIRIYELLPKRKYTSKTVLEGSTRRKINRSNRKVKSTSRVNALEIEYLESATKSLLNSTIGTLSENGRWHQVVSVLMAWSKHAKRYAETPILMESLLQLLVDEKKKMDSEHSNSIEITIDLYNAVLDAWVCTAFFQQQQLITPHRASQRAREILSSMQENYEQSIASNNKNDLKSPSSSLLLSSPQPDRTSFSLVLHCVCRIEGAFVARRVLAWMEYLAKSEKNIAARPIRIDYIMVLDSYTSLRDKNTPYLTEGFIRHMNILYNNNCNKQQLQLVQSATTTTTASHRNTNESHSDELLLLPDTYCYNILLKSLNKQVAYSDGRGGRVVAEQADRILEEMKCSGLPHCQPDLVTYSCTYTASTFT
jgi:hypothetical protein